MFENKNINIIIMNTVVPEAITRREGGRESEQKETPVL